MTKIAPIEPAEAQEQHLEATARQEVILLTTVQLQDQGTTGLDHLPEQQLLEHLPTVTLEVVPVAEEVTAQVAVVAPEAVGTIEVHEVAAPEAAEA